MFLELRSSDTTKLCVYCHTNRQTMAHSYIRLYFHLTFHTKTATAIQKEDLSDVYAYMSGVFHRYNITPLSIGGVGDHVHAILQFKESVIDFATVIRDVKTASNHWLKKRGIQYHKFQWRRGYGLFTISHDRLGTAIDYVRNQAEHHRSKTARDEYLAFLRAMNIEFYDKYVFSDD